MPLTEQQIQDRMKGIGGSDIASIINEEPYGCAYRLYLLKTGHEPKFTDRTMEIFERGEVMEEVFAAKYTRMTGRELRRTDTLFDPDKPWRRVNVDRLIRADSKEGVNGVGLLEIKSANIFVWEKFKAGGVLDSHILQAHWGMTVYGLNREVNKHPLEWAEIFIGNADNWEFRIDEIAYDHKIGKNVLELVDSFWRRIERKDPPEKLSADDERCPDCPLVKECRGEDYQRILANRPEKPGEIEEDDSLDDLFREAGIAHRKAGEAEKIFKEKKREIVIILGDKEAMIAGGYMVTYRAQDGKPTLDKKKLHEAHPETIEWFQGFTERGAPYRVFRIAPINQLGDR